MLYVQPNSWGYQWDNFRTNDTPSTSSIGVNATAHASADTKGTTWVNICTTNKDGAGSVTKITQDVYLVELFIYATFTAATIRGAVLDIGVDLAGGTTYSVVVSNILCGQNAGNDGATRLTLPLFINGNTATNATVGARLASNVGGSTATVAAYYYGAPSHPEQLYYGTVAQSVGVPSDGTVPTNCAGVAVVPGNSGAWGSWASLGTAAYASSYWNLCVQARSDTMTTLAYFFELGWGDATTPVKTIARNWCLSSTSEQVYWYKQHTGVQQFIPAGATLYCRGTCSGTAENIWTAAAYGV